jgi:gluconokinase
MGVSGSGKTSVGRLVAQRLGWAFVEGDDFHPEANVRKMGSGQPLGDEDRWPWLDALSAAARGYGDGNVVVTCSALKKVYRERLMRGFGAGEVRFVYLKAPAGVIAERMKARAGHFMKAGMLESQMATLEEPGADEADLVVTQGKSVEEVVSEVVGLGRPGSRVPGPASKRLTREDGD